MAGLRVLLICAGCWLTEISASWVRVLNSPRVLQADIQLGYKIDNLDPARFNDIHSLLYAGSELLYAARVPGGEGVLKVPCGVVTHAGTHSVTVCYTNNTVIATNTFTVSWPTIAVTVPRRIETFTEDVTVAVSFTNNICAPLSVLGNNNNKRVLQGGKRGLTDVWLKLERCESSQCRETEIVKIVKLQHFFTSHTSQLNLPCEDLGVAGLYRVLVGVETNKARNITRADTMIATSENFQVDWSPEYSLSLHQDAVESCQSGMLGRPRPPHLCLCCENINRASSIKYSPWRLIISLINIQGIISNHIAITIILITADNPSLPGHSLVVETSYPACILQQDKIRLYRQPRRPLNRLTYIGEQRVIKGDTAVVFPCSMFNVSSLSDVFCFHYVSTSSQGSVHTVQKKCVGAEDRGR